MDLASHKMKDQDVFSQIALSDLAVEGLESLGRSSLAPEVIRSLAEHSIELLLQSSSSTGEAEKSSNEKDVLVQNSELLEYGLSSLYTVAVKHQLERESLQQFMERRLNHLTPDIGMILAEIYERQRGKLSEKFATIGGNAFPHVTDIKWRQMTTVKASSMNVNRKSPEASSDGEVSFLINMGCFREGPSHSPSGHLHPQEGRQTIAEFVCNTEEMQLLINKLKEIQRHCVKFSNE